VKVYSRHRLPPPYRVLLTVTWVVPVILLLTAASIANRVTVLDVRALPLLILLLPAVYSWREGVDVRDDGIVRRIHIPALIRYDAIHGWTHERDLLIVWDEQGEKLLECHAAHLTDFPRLTAALHKQVQ